MPQHTPGDSSPSNPSRISTSTTPTPAPSDASPAPGPGVWTADVCERCGNVNLIRVKGCWYCEKCHHKFDCYGW